MAMRLLMPVLWAAVMQGARGLTVSAAPAPLVAVGIAARAQDQLRASALAAQLQLPLTDAAPFIFSYDAKGQLGLRAAASGLAPLTVDFLEGKMGYRAAHQASQSELVVKAVARKGGSPLVWDLTAGLGRDRYPIYTALNCLSQFLPYKQYMHTLSMTYTQ
jgi:Putative SAM-dependent methyltransferase